MFLEDIFPSGTIENTKLECKQVLNRDDVLSWLKTIAGFANNCGGTFLIGVKDKTNQLVGFEKDAADEERNYFNNQVNEHIFPRPEMKIKFIKYVVNEKERFIIQIQIEESNIKPVVLKYKSVPSIFMRREGFTNGATYEEIIRMSVESQSKNRQYDCLYSDELFDFTKFKKLQQFYFDHTGKKLNTKVLSSMGFFNQNSYLANGALLFKDDYQGNKTRLQCSLFSGLTRGSEKITSLVVFQEDLLSCLNDSLNFIKQHMNHSLIKLADSRLNIDSFPERAIFEALVNSLAHRDYYLDGTQIQVDIFKDRLEITSPGCFYQGEKINKTYDITGIISKRRNELISNIFVSCNIMEAAGTGFEKIAEDYKQYNQAHRPYIFSSSDCFTIVLPDLTYEKGVVDSRLPSLSLPAIPRGTVHDEKVLSYCYYCARKVQDIAQYLGIRDSSYLRKQILENLVNNNLLIKDKEGKSSLYLTNKEAVYLN